MNTEAERYLRRATRRLWGRRRLEVREELAAHLEGRVTAYRVAGLTEQDAVEKALAELGSPQLVNTGMERLYTLPTVLGSGAAFAAVCVAVVASLPSGLAQSVPGTFYWPSAMCIKAVEGKTVRSPSESCYFTLDSFWLNRDALKRALEPQGTVVSNTSVPGAGDEDGLLSVTFPGATPVYTSLGSPNFYMTGRDGKRIPMAEGYFSFWDFLQNASQHRELAVSVSGWDNPSVSFGDVSFRLGTESEPVTGEKFYSAYLNAILRKDGAFADLESWGGFALPSLQTDAEAAKRLARLQGSRLLETAVTFRGATKGVYGVVTSLEPNGSLAEALVPGDFPTDAFFLVQPVQIREDGTTTLELPNGTSTFVEGFSGELLPNTSMLVRLSGGPGQGRGWYEVIPPGDITLTAQN